MALTSTKLLSRINLKGALPEGRFEDSEILDLVYDVILSEVQPTIIGIREEYFVERQSFPITQGNAHIRIPDRAAGQQLREVKLIRGTQVIDLPQIDRTDVRTTAPGTPRAFYMESGYVVLYPTPAATADSVELSYFLRCSKPVTSDEVAVVTAIDPVTGVITAECPSTWSTADSFDIASRKNSGESLSRDLIATAVSTSSIQFAAADLPSELEVGDYVTLSDETFIIQVPDEAGPFIVQLVLCDAMQSLASEAELQAAAAKAESLRNQLIRLLTSRVIGEPRRFTPQV